MTDFDGETGVVAVGASAGGVEPSTRMAAATTALTGTALAPGNIYVAVSDRHLLVHDHQTLLTEGPTENGHRPAEALLRARDAEMESALWVALRSLQEKAKLSRHLAEQTEHGQIVDQYPKIADEAEHAVSVLSERLSAATRQLEDRGG